MNLGRNDPCHCGSGKKYKKCHLAEDEREERESRRQELAPEMSTGDIQSMLEFAESRPEIDRALKKLERHRPDFEKLLQDDAALSERATRLFGEPMFEPLWFTPDELAEALKAFGAPDTISEAAARAKMAEAIQSIATKEKRMFLGTRLMLLVRDLVAAMRFDDAWIVQLSAGSMIEETDSPNEFLTAMFLKGMERWAAVDNKLEREQLKMLGLTREELDSMTMEDLDRCVESLRADPVRCAELEAQLRGRVTPQAFDERIRHVEVEALRLIEEDGLVELLPTLDETGQWASLLHNRFLAMLDKYPNVPAPIPDEHPASKEAAELIWGTSSEMAIDLCTADRVNRFATAFRKVREEKFLGGEKKEAACLGAALALFERATDPGENPFLVQLCYSGIRFWASASSEEEKFHLPGGDVP